MPELGQLRERIVVQSPKETLDSYNQPVKSWVALCTRWARIDPITGRERYVAAQEVAMVSNRITVRYDSFTASITPEHRILWKDRIYDILSTRTLRERNRWVQMVCVEVIS